MAQLARVATGVFSVTTTVTGTQMPLSLYLLGGPDWLVTDTGCAGMINDLVFPALAELSATPAITRAVVCHAHADHFGGNAELKARNPACQIFVHEADADWAREPAWHLSAAYDALGSEFPCPPAVKQFVAGLLGPPTPVTPIVTGHEFALADGRTLKALHLPGHSPGHIGLWEREERLLILSDALLGAGQLVGDRVGGIPAYLDVEAYLGSVRSVRRLAPEVCCTAHFGVLGAEEVLAFCDQSEEFVKRFDAALWDALSNAPGRSLRHLTEELVPLFAPPESVSVVAAQTVQAHLTSLSQRGLAVWHMEGETRLWSTH